MFLTAHAVATEVIPATEPIKNDYIVILKDAMKSKVTELDIIQLINGGATSILEENDNKLLHMYTVIPGFAATLSPQGRANVLGSDLVESVYEDGIVRASTEWGLDRIDQRGLPVDNRYNPTFEKNGEGVTAYVIDTGILATHEDFEERATQEENFISGEDNVDCHGHGTHVAGTIGAKTYGVANKSKLVGLKVLGCNGSGTNSGVIAAVNWVKANHEKPAVVNMSLGSRGTNTPLATAIQNLVDAGVSVVVAAGNSNDNACGYSPAGSSAAITVGSTTSGDQRSSFSNYGTCVNIFAPGSSIKSTWIGGSNTATKTISGTSMASPHVCGAVALHLGDDQDLTPDQVRTNLLEDTTVGTISDIKSGSADKFLYVGETMPVMPTITPPTPSPVSSPVSRPTSRSPVSSPVGPPTSRACKVLCCYPIDEDGNGGNANDYMLGICADKGCHYELWDSGRPYCSGKDYYHQCIIDTCQSPISPPTALPISPPTASPTKTATVGPTAVPTLFPTNHPTVSPNHHPTASNCADICYENKETVFLLKVKNKVPKYETCEELAKMNDNQKKKICKRERKPLNGYGPASVHCRVTCSQWKTTECSP